MTARRPYLLLILLLTLAAYSNHFHNSFHFDDGHTIVDNPYLRSLSNLPLLFSDPHTFSTLPTHQVYRPLLSASLALDYQLGHGDPLPFHVTNLLFFLALLVCLYYLFLRITQSASPALLATALFALHPVAAETVNYIIQRGDLLSTLLAVAALLLFLHHPAQRRYGLYLLPLAAALLTKPPALIFPLLLLAALLLFETNLAWRPALRAIVPSLLTCAALAALLAHFTASTFNAGAANPALYRLTQPFAALYYFSAFFAPIHLTADSDWTVLPTLADPRALAGLAFLFATLAAIVLAARRPAWRPVSFGLFWFLATLFPTAWMPLAEVVNDHRMFFPFIGLALAVSWTLYRLTLPWQSKPAFRPAATLALTAILLTSAYATYRRNEVWRTEETLWRDAIEKSPNNGRALMNYALTLMSRNATSEALPYLLRAHELNPAYPFLEINLGVAYGALNQPLLAEHHFRRAQALAPTRFESHFFYARWLSQQNRTAEALDHLRAAVAFNPAALDPRHLLLQLLADTQDWPAFDALAAETLRLVPADPETLRLQELRQQAARRLQSATRSAAQQPTPEALISLSLQLHQAGHFDESIAACRRALALRPNYPEAWNNIAAAHSALHHWDEAIAAADQALRLRPNFPLAANNRAWALAQKQQAAPNPR